MDSAFEITREEGETKGRYWILADGHKAEMTYSRLGARTIIIDYTGVPDALRGRGVGQARGRGCPRGRARNRPALSFRKSTNRTSS